LAIKNSLPNELAGKRANEIAFICLQLFQRHQIVGRAAGVSLTYPLHRAAVKRQSQSDRGRGGTAVLGNIGGQVGSRSIASISCSMKCSCCCSFSNIK